MTSSELGNPQESAAEGTLRRVRRALNSRYAVECEIGRGGMATVFRAEDKRHERTVVVKALHPDLSDSIEAERFVREISTVSKLTHPNILPLLDSGSEGGVLFYVLPYVAGGSLRGRIDGEGPLDLGDVLRISRDSCQALGFAHRNGVVHRDIKPENVLLYEDRAVLSDFGIALAATPGGEARLTSAGLAMGTPAYMSPEQCVADSRLSSRSDIYSVACVVYEMLSGEPPFVGHSAQAVMAGHLQEPPPSIRVLRSSLPRQLEAVLRRALEKAPADRQKTIEQFQSELERAASGRMGSKWSMRSRWIAGGALAVSTLAISIWSLGRNPPPSPPQASWFQPTEIAARPFIVEGPMAEMSWLGRGLANEIIDALMKVAALSVRPLSATLPFPADLVPVDSVARALGIGTLVDGRVSIRSDSIRVSVYLIETQRGRSLGPAIRVAVRSGEEGALPQPIIDVLAGRLRQELGEQVVLEQYRRETGSSEAWGLGLQARGLQVDARTAVREGNLVHAMQLLDEAESLLVLAQGADPRWPRPHLLHGWILAERAAVAEQGAVMDNPGVGDTASVFAWIDRWLEHAETALRMKENDPEALELRGHLRRETCSTP